MCLQGAILTHAVADDGESRPLETCGGLHPLSFVMNGKTIGKISD